MEAQYEQLLARERAARAEAERAVDRTTRLQAITAALTAALTPEQVTEVIVQQGVVVLRASAGLTSLLTADGQHLQIVGATGYDEDTVRSWPPTPLTVATPTAHAVARGCAIWLESAAMLAQQYPQLAARPSLTGSHAFVALPLYEEGRPMGVLGFSFAEEQTFGPQDRAFMQGLAQYCALALERARLYEAERTARQAAEEAQARLRFLASASRTLATSLDYETTLRSIARLLVPARADWCAIDIVDEDGRLRRTIVARSTPAKSRIIRMSRRSQPLEGVTATTIGEVLRSGQATLLPIASPEILESFVLDPIARTRLRRLPPLSVMIVPLVGRDRKVGAITLLATASRRTYGEPDLELIVDLARRAALALDNSRLYQARYEAEQRIRLQAARLQALTEATHEFAATTLNWSALLGTILRRIVGDLGDCCIISLLAPDRGILSPVAVCHVDRARELILEQELIPEPMCPGEGVHEQVLATGQSRMISRRQGKSSSAQLEQLEPGLVGSIVPDVESVLLLPLRHREILGTVLISRDASWPEFTADDQTLLQELVDRAALALANAELHRQLGEREQHLSDLVGRLITSQEEERRRVAYEVHDGLAQVAVSTHQHLQAFARLHHRHSSEAHAALDRVLVLAQQTVDEARQVIAGLRPTVLDDFGLAPALGIQINALERTGWQVEFSENLGGERLSARVETALFRVAQEALNNVRKHAQTTRVRVALQREQRVVSLLVQDWGCGFVPGTLDAQTAPGERVGLPGMRERIALVGGRCEIDTAPGAGTRVKAEVPLS